MYLLERHHCKAETVQAGIAQSVEHFTRNEGVVGSSPISGLYILHHNLQDSEECGVFLFAPKEAVIGKSPEDAKEV